MHSYVIQMGPEPVTAVFIEENLETHVHACTHTYTHMHTRIPHWKKTTRRMRMPCGNEVEPGLMHL